MPDDYYSDGPQPEPAVPEPPSDEQQTAVIPKSLCPGMKVGDEVVLKIVADHAEEYEVAYESKEGSEDEGGRESESYAGPSNEGPPMASMME